MVVVYTLADRNQIRILSEWLMWLIMASEREGTPATWLTRVTSGR